MNLTRDYKARQADALKIKELELINPLWTLAPDPAQFTPVYYKKIGIDYEWPTVGRGFLKRYYSDFIVEELCQDGSCVNISTAECDNHALVNARVPRIGAVLIKQGVTTFEAIERLAEALDITSNEIGYAGLKDGYAVTAQEISINQSYKDENVSKLAQLNLSNIFLKDIHPREGVLSSGQLSGNRFTIFIRCEDVEEAALRARVDQLMEEGVLNYYSLQRFGSRLIAHKMGLLLHQKKYEEVARLYMVGESEHETIVMQDFRKEAAKHWGDWEKMAAIFAYLPYYFYQELKILESLIEYPRYFDHALEAVASEMKIIYMSYSSYCFNKLLSRQKKENQLSPTLPILGNDPEILKLYSQVIPEEELASLNFFHSSLGFLNNFRTLEVKTTTSIALHSLVPAEGGYIFNFDLQKGAYATSFLSQVFSLYQGKPIPDWVPDTQVDSKACLGQTPFRETELHFQENGNEENLVVADD